MYAELAIKTIPKAVEHFHKELTELKKYVLKLSISNRENFSTDDYQILFKQTFEKENRLRFIQERFRFMLRQFPDDWEENLELDKIHAGIENYLRAIKSVLEMYFEYRSMYYSRWKNAGIT